MRLVQHRCYQEKRTSRTSTWLARPLLRKLCRSHLSVILLTFPPTIRLPGERYYGYWSTETRRSDGMVVKIDADPLGQHHGCYSINKDNKIYSYMTGTFVGIPFTARGYCVFNPERAPEPPASAAGTLPYMCNYGISDLPEGYIGGQSTWNGMTTDFHDYLTTTIGTVRLWKKR